MPALAKDDSLAHLEAEMFAAVRARKDALENGRLEALEPLAGIIYKLIAEVMDF